MLRAGAHSGMVTVHTQHGHTHVCVHTARADAKICCVSAWHLISSILSPVQGWKLSCSLSSSLPPGVTHPSAGGGSSAWPQPAGHGSALHKGRGRTREQRQAWLQGRSLLSRHGDVFSLQRQSSSRPCPHVHGEAEGWRDQELLACGKYQGAQCRMFHLVMIHTMPG